MPSAKKGKGISSCGGVEGKGSDNLLMGQKS